MSSVLAIFLDGLEWPRGADTRIRTGDLPLTRRLLYQLSYAGMPGAFGGWEDIPTAGPDAKFYSSSAQSSAFEPAAPASA